MTNKNMNILISGKTGVGKSSLVNYIFNEDIVKAGSGKSKTAKTFIHIPMKLGEMPITLIDSWGIEIEKVAIWEKMIDEFLNEKRIKGNLKDQIHLILYCMDITGRIEQVDINMIKKFQQLQMKVMVVFTKGARVSEEDAGIMTKALENEIPKTPIFIVNSVEEPIMGGQFVAPQFGKQELTEAITDSYLETLRDLLPIQILKKLLKKIAEYKKYIAEPKRTKVATERANTCVNKLFREDLPAIINTCIEESIEYLSQSIYEFKTYKQYDNSDNKFKKTLTGIGIGGLILGVNPIVGLAVLGSGEVISWLMKKSSKTIAEDFERDMKQEIKKQYDEIKNIINGKIDAIQGKLSPAVLS